MNDNSEGNHGYETMLDYQLSWLMRLSAQKNVENKSLELICRRVMLKFLECDERNEIKIQEVKVWKQWSRIDLTAEVKILVNDVEEKHIVVIENKAYTGFHGNQLRRYRDVIDNHYGKEWHRHFFAVTFFDNDSQNPKWVDMQQQCNTEGWQLLSFYEVTDYYEKPTGSDLFDEFWINVWY